MEDIGDFSDFCAPIDPSLNEEDRKTLQEQQDQELARLLQDQEHKVNIKYINFVVSLLKLFIFLFK